MTDLHWTEVDDVATVWTDVPGPLRGGLLFGTGKVDETLATSGTTHLIEHLTLAVASDQAPQHNGFVGGVVTAFITMGHPDDVSSFFAKVCDALASLPGERLEHEKQVLAAENAARSYDVRSHLLTWRYGAAGYGLVGLPELGLQSATLEQLRAWAAQRFTKENAILWLSGPPPAALHLSLPRGAKSAGRSPVPILTTFPSWFVDNQCGGVALGATVPRVSASTVFCEVVSQRLRKRLRMDQAVSYAPAVSYEPLTADIAHLVLYADSDESRRAELAGAFGEVVQGLGAFDDAEVEAARRQILEQWIGSLAPPPADREMIHLQMAATDWIMGKAFEPLEVLATELRAVSVDDVAAFGGGVIANAMIALPGQADVQPWCGENAPASVGPVVEGRRVSHRDAPVRREQLVYGRLGVSILWPDGSHRTVRYSALAAALCYEDGAVCLISTDASSVMVEPTLWRDGYTLCGKIRELVPAQLLLHQRPRPPNQIPKPTTTAWQRLHARLRGGA